MKTKDEILTRLIKEGHVTLEEAVILRETQYFQPSLPPMPLEPYNPFPQKQTGDPFWWESPYTVSYPVKLVSNGHRFVVAE